MATLAQHRPFAGFGSFTGLGKATDAAAPAGRPGVFRRLFDAIVESQQRQAQREVNRVVAWRNGILNDELERQIGERMVQGNWTVRH